MLNLSNTLYAEISVLLLSLLSLIGYIANRYPKFRIISKLSKEQGSEDAAALTVIIICRDSADMIMENVPAILEQEYDNFEVIIIDDASTDNTKDAINILEHKYKNLRHTFLPPTTRYLSRKKLALTLGIRSAKNEWIVITEPDCKPNSSLWLKSLSGYMAEDKDFVLGYSNFEYSGTFHSIIAIYQKLISQMRFFHAAAASSNSKATGGHLSNMAIRKSVFMANKGFSKNLNLLHGEATLLLDEMAQKGRTAIAVTNQASVVQKEQPKKLWISEQAMNTETSRYLSRRAKWRRFSWALSSLLRYVYLSGFLCTATFMAYNAEYIYAAIIYVVLIANNILHFWFIKQSATVYNQKINFFLPLYFSLISPFISMRNELIRSKHKAEFYRKS